MIITRTLPFTDENGDGLRYLVIETEYVWLSEDGTDTFLGRLVEPLSGGNVVLWKSVVYFGQDHAHRAGGAVFVEAAKEQERVAGIARRGHPPR